MMSTPEKTKAADPAKAAALETTVTKSKYTAPLGLAHFERLFGRCRTLGSLDRSSLPTPLAYLTEWHLLCRKTRGEWASVRCPVHKGGDEAHPSMRVSLVDGHFRCMACGIAGGDIVALHRLVTGLGFRDAVHDLGGRFHD